MSLLTLNIVLGPSFIFFHNTRISFPTDLFSRQAGSGLSRHSHGHAYRGEDIKQCDWCRQQCDV